nr:ent-copalyl diphosphate synthase, chloroplastic-like [Tanacetum cinerariifolium]
NGKPWHGVMVALQGKYPSPTQPCLGDVADGLEKWTHPRYQRLSTLTNNICNEISEFHNSEENLMTHCGSGSTNKEIDSRMQELVQLVLCDSPDDLDQDLKHMFLTVAKTFYYKAYCDPETMNAHISKVLFEVVV